MTYTISIFMGSIRNERQGEKVAKWVVKTFKERGYNVNLIDPNEHEEILTLRLPNHYNPKPSKDMLKLHQWLVESDGFILITPEYNHSFSGTIKNALDNFMPEYEKKPFGIISYSIQYSGGIRANEALRIVVSELKGVATPIPLMIPFVQDVFDVKGLKEKQFDERLSKFIENYEWYLDALKKAREKKK